MAISRISPMRSRDIAPIAFFGLAAVLLAGCAGASAGSSQTAGTSAAAASASAGTGTVPAPSAGAPAAIASGVAATGIAVGGAAIAYPYPGYPGNPGLAPDHTIVVSGFGRAPVAADGSDRAKAEQTALKAALADARTQADVVAASTGVTISGVLSVSVSNSQGFCCPVPLAMGAPGAPAGPGSGGAMAPAPAQPPAAPTPELDVSVTVAYRIA